MLHPSALPPVNRMPPVCTPSRRSSAIRCSDPMLDRKSHGSHVTTRVRVDGGILQGGDDVLQENPYNPTFTSVKIPNLDGRSSLDLVVRSTLTNKVLVRVWRVNIVKLPFPFIQPAVEAFAPV